MAELRAIIYEGGGEVHQGAAFKCLKVVFLNPIAHDIDQCEFTICVSAVLRSNTTHVVATNLPYAKVKEMLQGQSSKGRQVVTPVWIVKVQCCVPGL